MPFQIIHQNIAKFSCDAIVNPTDRMLSGSGGADNEIHTAAGRELDRECENLQGLGVGEIAVTGAYNLPCRFIFHTVGPVWENGSYNEAVLLRSCYLNALLKAKKMELTSIAFPLISSGTFGFPKDKVLRIAIDAISDFLFTSDQEMQIYVCILDRTSFELSKEIALKGYLTRNSSKVFDYKDHALKMRRADKNAMPPGRESAERPHFIKASLCNNAAEAMINENDLEGWLRKQDDSFAVTLLKLIDKIGLTDVQCYKKANVSKGTFWKINNDPNYKPSKQTVIAFAIALELNLDETEQLLKTVGFSLSNSNTFDRIIQFFIMNGIYDIFEINAALYKYDQVCLGC